MKCRIQMCITKKKIKRKRKEKSSVWVTYLIMKSMKMLETFAVESKRIFLSISASDTVASEIWERDIVNRMISWRFLRARKGSLMRMMRKQVQYHHRSCWEVRIPHYHRDRESFRERGGFGTKKMMKKGKGSKELGHKINK